MKKEKFLILEILPSGTNGLFLTVREDRTITLEKFVHNISLKKFLRTPLRRVTQKAWEGEYLFKSRRKVIATADSTLATTIPLPLELPRERTEAKFEITLPDWRILSPRRWEKFSTNAEAKRRNALASTSSTRSSSAQRHAILG